MKPTLTLLCSIAIAGCPSVPALASLGGDTASVDSDRAAMKGALQTTSGIDYSLHEIHTSAGMVVHEYVSPQGKVFAVTWRGAGLPDLAHLLGSYSAQLAQAQTRSPHYNHHHLRIETPEVVMQSDAYLRSRFGRAWVPALLPPSFSQRGID